MGEKSIFISSCSRRQLARRRSPRGLGAIGPQLMLALVVLVLCLGAFAAGHGGL